MSTQEIRSYTVMQEPRAELYRAILAEAIHRCDRFSLVQRSECTIAESGERILEELYPHLLRERTTSEWPGTKLIGGGVAILREYVLSAVTVALLGRAVEGLYDWCQPDRPEDIVLWRTADAPWLVTIAHERDAYFEVTPSEREGLFRAIPSLSTMIASD